MLFLQDFDIIWGINIGLADTLSRKDEVDMDDGNWEITLLKGDPCYHHIKAINTALTEQIALSSSTGPIVIQALATMNNTNGEPWIPQTNKSNWEFIDNTSYLKH